MRNFDKRLRAVQSIAFPELVGCPYCNPPPPSARTELAVDMLRLLMQWSETPGQPELAISIAENYERRAALERLHPDNAKPVRAPCKHHACIPRLADLMAEARKDKDGRSGEPELPHDAAGWRLLAAQCGQARPNEAKQRLTPDTPKGK